MEKKIVNKQVVLLQHNPEQQIALIKYLASVNVIQNALAIKIGALTILCLIKTCQSLNFRSSESKK